MDVYTYKPTFVECEACGHKFRAGAETPGSEVVGLCVTCERLIRLGVRTFDQLQEEAEKKRR